MYVVQAKLIQVDVRIKQLLPSQYRSKFLPVSIVKIGLSEKFWSIQDRFRRFALRKSDSMAAKICES